MEYTPIALKGVHIVKNLGTKWWGNPRWPIKCYAISHLDFDYNKCITVQPKQN
jgi:hypothetical protein